MPLRVFVPIVLEAGIYAAEDLRRITFRAVSRDCAKAISELDPVTGLPFAQPTDVEEPDETAEETKRGPTWLQLHLFDQDQLMTLIRRRLGDIRHDLASVRRLADYCRERFGAAPEIRV